MMALLGKLGTLGEIDASQNARHDILKMSENPRFLSTNMDGKISEQRVYCKIRAQLRFPLTETHADLQEFMGMVL